MKLILLALLTAFALSALSASAQNAPRDVDAVIADSRVKRMTTVLTLTDDQKEKARPLILEEIKKFKTFREDTNLTEADRVTKEKAFREESKPKFKALLTEEQFAKYEVMQKEKRVKKPAK